MTWGKSQGCPRHLQQHRDGVLTDVGGYPVTISCVFSFYLFHIDKTSSLELISSQLCQKFALIVPVSAWFDKLLFFCVSINYEMFFLFKEGHRNGLWNTGSSVLTLTDFHLLRGTLCMPCVILRLAVIFPCVLLSHSSKFLRGYL